MTIFCCLGKNGKFLNIQAPVRFDESISHIEERAHQPHQPYPGSTFDSNDEICIAIQP